MKDALRLALFLLLLLLSAHELAAQGTVTGQEQVITYSGTNVPISPPNTPALNFQTNGTNTFIIPVAPTVSLRIYITNNTANACSGAFTLQMWSATDNQTNSFNNALANWQSVLLQSPTGVLVNSITVNIPASGAVYISSTAISAPKVAVQLVNTTASCSTTNVEVTGVITSVSVTSPLVSTVNNNPSSSVGNQVQGVVSAGNATSNVNPIVISGQGPAINGGFLTSGLDTVTPLAETSGLNGTSTPIFNGKAPVPTQSTNEISLGIFSQVGAGCGALLLSSPWAMVQGTPIPGGGNYGTAFIYPATGGQNLVISNSNPGGCPWNSNATIHTIMNFISTGPTGGVNLPTYTQLACCSLAYTGAGNPAKSTILIMIPTAVPNTCTVTGVTDTLGLSYANIGTFFDATITGANNISGMSIWASTSTNPGGADTVTAATTGTCGGGGGVNALYMDIPGTSSATLVQPSIPLEVDSQGGLVVRQDALGVNQVTCSVTLSTNTTTQLANCIANPTINGVSGRYYVTDIQLNTTTAGTATTIQLKAGTGVNCASATVNLSSILYPNTTVGLTTVQGFRTPLIAPATDEICATQAGTTAGTTTVEIHAYIAP